MITMQPNDCPFNPAKFPIIHGANFMFRPLKTVDYTGIKPLDAADELKKVSLADDESKKIQESACEGQMPLIDEMFSSRLNTIIMQYIGVETIQLYNDTDINDPKFDELHLVKRYQKKLGNILPVLWKNEAEDLLDLVNKKESKDITYEKWDKTTYNFIHIKYKSSDMLYGAISDFIRGDKKDDLDICVRQIIHYCRYYRNFNVESLLVEAIECQRQSDTQERRNGLNRIIKLLVDEGAATNKQQYSNSVTPLFASARLGSPALTESLLKLSGLDLKSYRLYIDDAFIYPRPQFEWSPLLQACYYNSVKVIEKFLQVYPEDMPVAKNVLVKLLNYLVERKQFHSLFPITAYIGRPLEVSGLILAPREVQRFSLSILNAKFGLFKLLCAASNINNFQKNKIFQYAGEHSQVVEFGLKMEINEANDVDTLKFLYSEVINSNLLDIHSKLSFLFSEDMSLKVKFIAMWREKAFNLLNASAPNLLPLAYKKSCEDLIGHDAFSDKYEHLKNGVKSDHRLRLKNIFEKQRNLELSDENPVTTYAQKGRK